MRRTTKRGQTYDVFVVPGGAGLDTAGMAWLSGAGDTHHVNVFADPRTPYGMFILLHEVAHHELGHTRYVTSRPHWLEEYQASRHALDRLDRKYDEVAVFPIRETVRERTRRLVQPFLDCGIYQHGEIDAAVWAGADIPVDVALGDW